MYETLAKHVVYPFADAASRTKVTRYLAALEESQATLPCGTRVWQGATLPSGS